MNSRSSRSGSKRGWLPKTRSSMSQATLVRSRSTAPSAVSSYPAPFLTGSSLTCGISISRYPTTGGSYFIDPHGNTVEYSTELEQVDEDTWHPHLYDFTSPEVADQWGTANSINEAVAARSFNDPDRGLFTGPPVLLGASCDSPPTPKTAARHGPAWSATRAFTRCPGTSPCWACPCGPARGAGGWPARARRAGRAAVRGQAAAAP
jgi:hypothetical protein